MAGEELLSSAELLANIPDNTSQLVDPLDIRNLVIGLPPDSIIAEDETPFTIPIVTGTPVVVNNLLPSPAVTQAHWMLDGNQAFIPDWAGIIVNSGLTRIVNLTAVLSVSKVGGGNDDYGIDFFIGGVLAGAGSNFEIKDIDTVVTVVTSQEYDHSVAAPIDLRVTGIGTGDDLDVSSILIGLTGSLL